VPYELHPIIVESHDAEGPFGAKGVGEVCLVPVPAAVRNAVKRATGVPLFKLPLNAENDFLPDLDSIPADVCHKAKLLVLCYPNSPTGRTAPPEFYERAIVFAKKNDIVIIQDAAHGILSYDRPPNSFLAIPGARDVGVEVHSMSKAFDMIGWRIGWPCGNAQLIAALGQLKTNLDSGIFQPIQWAGITALEGDQAPLQQTIATYQQRRDLLIDGLAKVGWQIAKPKASLYIWTRVPTQDSSIDFAARVLEQAHVVLTPGVGFGPAGEGYIRMSLTVPTARIEEAVSRLGKILS
jgi:LL-diaminopimelate aminotransferase